MSSRAYPWVLAEVAWSPDRQFTRGTHEGLPLLSWNIAPRTVLATRRQLRAMDPPMRPGGADPVALLYFRCRKACRMVFAELFLIADAVPVRPMTGAKWAAVDKALAARRTCLECGSDGGYYLPRHRVCEPCRYTLGLLDAADYLHDYLTGHTTLTDEERAALAGIERQLAEVVPLHHARSAQHAAAWGWVA